MSFKIVKVLNDLKVVMNAGSKQKIVKGQKFLIYELSNEEIIDPDTKKSLGFLEIVKGTGVVTHVQENMSTIEAFELETSSKTIRHSGLFGDNIEEVNSVVKPFDNPRIGDLVKRVN